MNNWYYLGDACTKIGGGLIAGGMVAVSITGQAKIMPILSFVTALFSLLLWYHLMHTHKE